ncbi:glycoside hydrolase [Sphingobacterium sp. DN00404]|uniref:Glycoside hydrolase n=1 Tax=Sphingobacterium micropteri TaxID=2763501 RepID=A0ABR7YQ95_9SPHI|nr:alpha-L-rhamnosidase C-terminal domain-containing protein [Sphingobacterium micropteri]MBD1433348.1 glycoside hydrolase [Sphingobacterium micropteri]
MRGSSLKIVVVFFFIGYILIGKASAQPWKAKWIGIDLPEGDTVNVWAGFRKDFVIDHLPTKLIARIAVDSKYWLYINDKLVIFEGGLKRGPTPNDTYYDEFDIAPYLKKGGNTIGVKVWYFGKNGFSHKSSGMLGLFFDAQSEGYELLSDSSWMGKRLEEYGTSAGTVPNFRLSESNIQYDARITNENWYKLEAGFVNPDHVKTYGEIGIHPWNKLVKRPIPLWKDYGERAFNDTDITEKGDTVICKLPYNMQFTPIIDVEGSAGDTIQFLTDNYLQYNGGAENISATYITKEGRQKYESLGWLNGHYLYVVIPKGIRVHKLHFRETGYDTAFEGEFHSSDLFFNKLWDKAARTLYITMRDNYMDCPDRERAQWTGDAVLECEEAFYALTPSSHALGKKWLYELIGWQKEDGALFSPIPAGNWDSEIADQSLASIGFYGIWTYYMHTGDKQLLIDLFPAIQKYLQLWEKDSDGLVRVREGGWLWGDWGDHKDMLLIHNLWYYLAIKGNQLIANELRYDEQAKEYRLEMEKFKTKFNERFWNGQSYRDPKYTGETDDRVHALAVLADIADEQYYDQILKVFLEEEHASPYMEKYVFEAMYKMREPAKANARHRKRFSGMVNNEYFTTLFEGWGIGREGFGGGTVNHAWSGGGLTVLSSRLCGIRPLTPGYKTFLVAPQPGDVREASAKVASVRGDIFAGYKMIDDRLYLDVVVPNGTTAHIKLPIEYRKIKRNGRKSTAPIELQPGTWEIIARR